MMAPEDRSSIIRDWTDCFWDMRAKREVNSSSVSEGPEAAILKIRMVEASRCYWRCVVCHFEKTLSPCQAKPHVFNSPTSPPSKFNTILVA